MTPLSELDKKGLFNAIRAGQLDVVEYYFKRPINPEIRNQFGWTPLMVAAMWGRLAIVKLLIKHKANLNAHSNLGMTPLMLAELHNQKDVVKLLANKIREIE